MNELLYRVVSIYRLLRISVTFFYILSKLFIFLYMTI